MHHWATPQSIVKAKAAEAAKEHSGQQELGFKVVKGSREFTRAGTLNAVAKIIATNNQVSFIFQVLDIVKQNSYQFKLASHTCR